MTHHCLGVLSKYQGEEEKRLACVRVIIIVPDDMKNRDAETYLPTFFIPFYS
jgi:hypothetical protein